VNSRNSRLLFKLRAKTVEEKKKKKKGKRRKPHGTMAVWSWRTTCGGEADGWSWLQVAEQEERWRRKSAGERDRPVVYALPLVMS
jgi:hypothetical protein